MGNIESVFKAEIARVARREVRAEVDGLKKATSQYRTAIAQLRRQMTDLERQLKQAKRLAGKQAPTATPVADAAIRRFSAPRLAAHRAKTGLSAAAYGKLIGISGATIYLWEQEKSRPNKEQLERLAAVRALSASELTERLSEA